jgi:O-antigen ligase
MTRRWLEPVAFGAGAALVGAALVSLEYATEPALALGIFAALGAVALVLANPIAGVCVAIALAPAEVTSLSLGPGGLTPAEGMLVLTGWTWAARRLAQGHAPFTPSPLGAPLALMLVAVLPGFAVAIDTSAVLKLLLMWSSFYLVYQLVVSEAGEAQVRTILYALTFSAAVVALVAIVRSGGRPQELLDTGTRATGRAVGTFTQPNLLATFLALGLPAALALGLRGRAALRPACLVAFVVVFAGLALSLSRGGAFAALGALALFMAWAAARRLALVGLAVVAVVAVVGGNPFGNVAQVDAVVQRVSSVEYTVQAGADPRFLLWRTSPEIIVDHPLFGVGAGQFPLVAPRYGLFELSSGKVFDHAHNAALTIAVELGVLGLAALAWLVAALAVVAVRALRRQRGPGRPLAFAVAGALLALGLELLVDYTVRSNLIAATALVLMGCAVVLARPASDEIVASARPAD